MLVAIALAFLAGLITAISPCVLPVLPIVLAGGASGGRRRPYAIVAGMVTCFLVSILFAAWILDQLGLPQDLLRNISIGLLFLVAATLIVPQLGALIERPLARMARGPSGDLGGGFVLGAALGFVFVPCGGPAIGFVTSSAASLDFGFKTLAVAVSYTVGVAAVLLAIAIGGRRAAGALRSGVERFRIALGVVIAAAAVALIFNVDTKLQTRIPGWTDVLQRHTEDSAAGRKAFAHGASIAARSPVKAGAGLPDYGKAPGFSDIQEWLNTPGGRPLSMAGLRGKVVLIDFWTYSCINCLRTLPHLKAWYATYGSKGLVIVGVHSPEFAFEHVPSNVRAAVKRLGVQYPVALDNDFGTWATTGSPATRAPRSFSTRRPSTSCRPLPSGRAASPTAGAGGSRLSGSRAARARACDFTSMLRTCTSCSAGRDACRCWWTGKRCGPCAFRGSTASTRF